MVSMNAADDKENITKPNKINGLNCEAVAGSSTMYADGRDNIAPPQIKLNGSSPQIGDRNKHTITNGAYPKVSANPCNAASACERDGPSVSRKNSIVLSGKSENTRHENTCGESERGLPLRNKVECLPENGNRPVSVQKQPKPRDKGVCDYDRNSSSEDEECCIYTYKGDSNQMADLPSSFFRLDFLPSRPNPDSRNSSPDMDYLEMDFDPGPSNDRNSSSNSECGDERVANEWFVVEESPLPKPQADREEEPVAVEPDAHPQTPVSPLSTPSPVKGPHGPDQSSDAATAWSPPDSPQMQSSRLDVDAEVVQPPYCHCIANKLSPISIDENFNEGDTGTMVWKEQEAGEKQVTQIETSACGATAVINTLLGLNVPLTVSAVTQHVATRLRSEAAPVVEYLLSRSNAGATHADMIRGLHEVSQGLVYARFFHMFPQRSISLTSWLSHWIRKGAVPIATLNLQRRAEMGREVPDRWHHQMIYGVSAQGVHFTNPLEVQSEARLWPQLASPSVLLVRRDDVLSRWTPDTLLHPLIDPSRPLWRKLNVLGQVVNVVREGNHCSHSTQHITIPASYSSGITLAVLTHGPAYDELRFAPELPVDPFASS